MGSADAGGYVGTFEIGKRFLAPKSTSKQGELACIPPILKSGALLYRPSTFRIKSTCGLATGTPVSYGDVVVLVDERGHVWNNKIGVGPTTKNGYFGPRDQNTPGEMFLAFYQLLDEDNSSSSESSDDEDSFLSFSSIAKTTKTMAETTFGKPTQVEVNLAATALRTVGRVVYYGDRNVVIDVADSNRIRSKFNRVITHYRKNDTGLPVQGGYLRCDGRGKTILFELHGPPLPTVESIDIREERASNSVEDSDANDDGDTQSTRLFTAAPSRRMSLAGSNAIKNGQPISIRNLRRSSTLSVQFSDGGAVHISCTELTGNAAGESFYKLVLGGARPTRIFVQSKRSQRRRRTVGFRETLQGTYKELFKLFGFVVVTYSCGAYIISRVFGSVVLLPAMYVGVTVAFAVFLVEVFFPGRIMATRKAAAAVVEVTLNENDSIGDWEFAILALEASESECIKSSSLTQDETLKTSKKKESAAVVVPKSFLVAENGNAAKAAERYEVTLAWRQEVNADGILGVPQQHYDTIKACVVFVEALCGLIDALAQTSWHSLSVCVCVCANRNYKQYLHKQDKLGHPVYFEKMASINIKQLQRSGTLEHAIR